MSISEVSDQELSLWIATKLEPIDHSAPESKLWRMTRNPSEMSAAALDAGASIEILPSDMVSDPEMTVMLLKGNNILGSNAEPRLKSDRQAGFAVIGLAFALALCCLIIFWFAAFLPIAERNYSISKFIGKLQGSPVIEKRGFPLLVENVVVRDEPDEKQVGLESINGLPVDLRVFTSKPDNHTFNGLFHEAWQFHFSKSAANLAIYLNERRVQGSAFYKTKSGAPDARSSGSVVVNLKRKFTDDTLCAFNRVSRRDDFIAKITRLDYDSRPLSIDDQFNALFRGLGVGICDYQSAFHVFGLPIHGFNLLIHQISLGTHQGNLTVGNDDEKPSEQQGQYRIQDVPKLIGVTAVLLTISGVLSGIARRDRLANYLLTCAFGLCALLLIIGLWNR